MGAEVYQVLKGIIKDKYGQDSINVGDEGGFAPNILANDEGLQLVVSAINKAGYEGKVKIGMDVAASEFWNAEAKRYDLNFKYARLLGCWRHLLTLFSFRGTFFVFFFFPPCDFACTSVVVVAPRRSPCRG
jgi:enolase